MGIVYEGRDPNLDRRVAIKTVKVENMSEEAAAEYEARFRTEARSAARLQHPNIVSVYDSDRDGDIAFLVMEYIQGDDLKHHIDKGERYTLDQSLKMIRDLLAALDYAHKQGIVHRDIKPANLLIEPGGRIKLTDFGVARIQDSGEATRTQGAMVGTLKYMSPEQVQGQPVDSRADLFSVGIVLYQLLTDKRPFDGENDFSIIHQIIGHSPTPPSVINPQLPPAIDAVVARALAKKRDERFTTARDFAVALQAAIRRASDQTIVPPANPGKQDQGADTKGSGVTMGSATSGTSATSATSTNTSTVTQELELVYWKDIKDSVEPEEIEGFLVKFPTGIYADLARRRLKKLASGASMDATMGSYGTQMPASSQDTDATRMRDFSRPAVPDGATSPGSSSGSGTGTRGGDYTRTLIQPRTEAGAAAPGAARPAEPAPVDPRDAPTIPPVPSKPAAQAAAAATAPAAAAASAGKSRTPLYAAIGVAAIALIGIALKFTSGGSATPAVDAAASAASSPAAVASSASAQALPASAVPAAAVAASSPASAASAAVAAASRPAASAPRPTASQLAARPKPKDSAPVAAPAVVPAPSQPQPAAPAPRVEARPAQTPTAAPVTAANPKDACEGRMLLGFQICMSEQCARPVFQNHPTCVERRDMERRQREQQQRIIN